MKRPLRKRRLWPVLAGVAVGVGVLLWPRVMAGVLVAAAVAAVLFVLPAIPGSRRPATEDTEEGE